MATRYKMTMAYDGHLFHGFQLQPDQRTVQGTVEDALKKIQIQKEMEAAEDELEDIDEHVQLEDQDYEDFYEDVNNQKERDMKVLLGEEG